MNWVDWVIVLVGVYYVADGWETGLARKGTGLMAFMGSLWLAVRFHGRVGQFAVDKFGVPDLWAGVLGYAAVAMVAEVVISDAAGAIFSRVPEKAWSGRTAKLLGAGLSAATGITVTAFVLLVVMALPVRGTVKRDIRSSVIGARLVEAAQRYGGQVKSELERTAREAVKFLTIKPQSDERVDLRPVVRTGVHFEVNETLERKMVELVNRERARAGVKELTVDTKMVVVARGHSRDMLERKYFSHIDSEGHDVGYRMEKGGVDFQTAGENLAYAPDVQAAHEGLMNSEGHRRNILDGSFGRIGIGIIDGGDDGIMVTQVFAN